MNHPLRTFAAISAALIGLGFASCSSYQVGVDRTKDPKEIEEETAKLLEPQGRIRNQDVDNPYNRGY